MNINELLHLSEELLQLNEMAITPQNSGPLLPEPFNITEFIDKCYTNHDKYPMDTIFRTKTGLTLTGFNPQNPTEPFIDDVQLLYGSKYMGIKHIIEHREGEFNNTNRVSKLSEDKVKEHLINIPKALTNGKVLRDYIIDKESNRSKTYFPYGDRLIILYNDIFYVFLLKSDNVFCTCLNTMFKPTPKYKDLILKLNGCK